MQDKNGYKIMETSDDPDKLVDFKLKADTAAEMTYAVVEINPKVPNEPTTLKIRFMTVHRLPAKSILDIEYPKELKLDENKLRCYSDANAGEYRRCKVLSGTFAH